MSSSGDTESVVHYMLHYFFDAVMVVIQVWMLSRFAIVLLYQYYIEKKLHTVYPMLYKPTLKNSKN